MQNLFLIGSQVTMATRLVDPVTLVPAPPSGSVATRVAKGDQVKTTGTAQATADGKWSFSYQPNAWETGDYVMEFNWSTVVAGSGASGEPVEVLVPMSLYHPFSIRATVGEIRDLGRLDPGHACEFRYYDRIDVACEFDELIDRQGMWFVLFHRYSSTHCSCWNEVNGSAVTSCPYCGGTGYPHKEIPFRARFQFDDKDGRIFQAGVQLVNYMRFFTLRGFEGIRGDQIWQVAWKDPSRPDLGFERPPVRRFGIVITTDHYGDNHDGRVSYREVVVEELALANNRAQIT